MIDISYIFFFGRLCMICGKFICQFHPGKLDHDFDTGYLRVGFPLLDCDTLRYIGSV